MMWPYTDICKSHRWFLSKIISNAIRHTLWEEDIVHLPALLHFRKLLRRSVFWSSFKHFVTWYKCQGTLEVIDPVVLTSAPKWWPIILLHILWWRAMVYIVILVTISQTFCICWLKCPFKWGVQIFTLISNIFSLNVS